MTPNQMCTHHHNIQTTCHTHTTSNDEPMPTPRKTAAIALLTAIAGIIIQIIGGHDYPTIPPGIIILAIAAAIVWFVHWRWSPTAAILAALFLIFGLFAADQATRLIQIQTTALDTIGLWIQMASVVIALVAAVLAMARPSAAPVRG
jgi:hypothetical protein